MSEVAKPQTWTVSTRLKSICASLMFIGLISFILSAITDPDRAWHAYMLGFFYTTSLAVGGLFFTAVQHAVNAGWSVNIRRFCESHTAFLPHCFVAALVFVLGVIFSGANVYDWLNPAIVAKDHLLQHKAPYLNQTFFIIRTLVFLGLWVFFAKKIVGHSLKQDGNGDLSWTKKNVSLSVGFLLIFALSYSLFSIDILMSLEAHWFSTIFGVYTFAGLFQATMASMLLFIFYIRKKGLLHGYVDENHIHDLGKFLFAFTIFWAYIAFSQYMLIWYANLPEETIFFMPRSHGAWVWVSLALIVFKFIVPFIALLSRRAKRNPAMLGTVAVLILIMQFVDLYWLIYPNLNSEHEMVFGFTEIAVFFGFVGGFVFVVSRFLSQNPLVPYSDPRIHESMHHHVTY